jgi:hypothetical protein
MLNIPGEAMLIYKMEMLQVRTDQMIPKKIPKKGEYKSGKNEEL